MWAPTLSIYSVSTILKNSEDERVLEANPKGYKSPRKCHNGGLLGPGVYLYKVGLPYCAGMERIKVPAKKTYLGGKGLVRGLERMNKSIFPKGITVEKLIKSRLRKGKVRLLEIGCGQGVVLKELREKFGNELELYGSNLLESHGFAKGKGIRMVIDDIAKSKFRSNSFDIIVSQVSFPHIIRKDRALEEVYRILKPKGIAFIEFDQKLNRNFFKKKMPELFRKLNKSLGKEALSRFIIYRNGKFYSLFRIFDELNKKGCKIKMLSGKSKGETDYFYNLEITKTLPSLKLPLRYNLKESRRLARIPLGYGYVDVYDYS
jgi:ubiquinone/menaquinone biosynthesis C-methylase UbiE